MTITFGGLATGLDTNSLIDGLMAIERIPLQRNQAKQASLTSAQSTLSSFLSAVVAIKTAAETLDTAAEFASFSAESTDPDSVLPTITGAASAGSYSVKVNALALETRTKSDPFASSTTALGQAGNLNITVGGSSPVAVAIVASDSLASIATKINSSGARVNASIVYDGTQNRLLVVGKDTGSANQVTYTETGTVALNLDVPGNTYQSAQNAQILLDNQFTISRSTNNFTDVVPGVTITTKAVTAAAEQITITPDPEALETKIQALVSAYNTAISAGHLASGYGTTEASNSNLSGDSAIRTTLDTLAKTISQNISGLTGKYTMLASVGVNLTQDGELEIDTAKLTAALNADPVGVSKVFVGDSATSTKGVMQLLAEAVERMAEGGTSVLENRIDAFDSQIERLQEDELTLEARLDAFETSLRKKFTDLEVLVSKIQQQGNSLSGFTTTSYSSR